jgi:methylmalonyl-CoA mutase
MTRSPLYRPSGLQLKALYRPCDLIGIEHLDSDPGKPPYLRGPYASMYTHKPWTIRQYTGFADAQLSNQRLRQSLAEGAQGLSVAFDLPTHRGYDSDDAHCSADVGKTGVAIDSAEDMLELFDGIALDRVSVSMTMNGAVLPVLAAFIVAAQERGIAKEQLSGTIQNDILKEFLVRNTYIFAPEPSLRICTDVIEYFAQHMPRFNPISVSGYHFQEAGADPILELALTLLNARTYVEQVRLRGLDVNAFCSRMSFFFGVGNDFFTEVAKLRAARVLWNEISEQLGADNPSARAMRMHCQTSGWTLCAQDPMNNVVRTTAQAMAAVFGGTQSLHTNAWDEAIALPSESSARLASNTQQILQEETGLCDVIDPWAGSYMMESLTETVCREVRACIARIDGEGGVVAAINNGSISTMIHAQAVQTQARLDTGELRRVGEKTASAKSQALHMAHSVDSFTVRQRQTRRLKQLRIRRDEAKVQAHLQALTHFARNGQGNLLELSIAAISARATVGECTAALEKAWPRHRQTPAFLAAGYGSLRNRLPGWSALCERISRFSTRHGRPPTVLLGKLGQDGHDRGIRLIASVLVEAGFSVTMLPLFQSPTELLVSMDGAGPVDLIGLSSLAGAHNEILCDLLEHLRRRRIDVPIVLGGIIPESDVASLTLQGVRAVFGPGKDLLEIAKQLMSIVEQQSIQARKPDAARFSGAETAAGAQSPSAHTARSYRPTL